MQTTHKERLTAAEIGSLWTIKPVLEYALHSIKKQIQALTDIFESDRFPIPIGFTEKDVDAKAPRLFSDGLGPVQPFGCKGIIFKLYR